jgi:hypothetical protein
MANVMDIFTQHDTDFKKALKGLIEMIGYWRTRVKQKVKKD